MYNEPMLIETIADDDCEDQALAATEVCLQFKCQQWRPGASAPDRPKLEAQVRGSVRLWICPCCQGSYGEAQG